jgi:hypothetical protein
MGVLLFLENELGVQDILDVSKMIKKSAGHGI